MNPSKRLNQLAIALLAALPLCGADEALPSVETVMNHFVAATGGKAAWDARHSQVEHATIDFAKQGLKGSLTIYESAPDKYLGVTELPGIGKIATGSNGEVAWENSALRRSWTCMPLQCRRQTTRIPTTRLTLAEHSSMRCALATRSAGPRCASWARPEKAKTDEREGLRH